VRPDPARSNLAVHIDEVVAYVEAQILRPTWPPRRSHDDGVHGRNSGKLVMHVRSRDLGRKRYASAVSEEDA
jgi:hypothetical protein